jgi:release factor glutamine methyltransferase
MTTWRELRDHASSQLGDALDAQRIVEVAGGFTPTELRAEFDERVSDKAQMHVDAMIARRLTGVPLQHVLGQWSFRSLDIAVDPRALIPRPETEMVVEYALQELRRLETTYELISPVVADLGTGSGVIALAVAVETTHTTVLATERSAAALSLARANLAGTGGRAAQRVRMFEGSWFEPLPDSYRCGIDLVITNPPYLADDELESLDPDVRDHDPHDALFAGPTGYECFESIISQLDGWLAPHGTVVLEHSPWQGEKIQGLLVQVGFTPNNVLTLDDLAGRPRVTIGRR